jgi:uncharacterized protein YdeI (YjbR/CyaY-like superfamily)
MEVRNMVMPDIPEDLLKELNKNKTALNNFQNFPVSIRRVYLQWLSNAKREETYSRRIRKILELAEKNIKNSML